MNLILPDEYGDMGLKIGKIGIGLLGFPWVDTRGLPKHYISFWSWLFCAPKIRHIPVKYIQLRFMWFVIQVTT